MFKGRQADVKDALRPKLIASTAQNTCNMEIKDCNLGKTSQNHLP